MLSFCHTACRNTITINIIVTHVQLAHTYHLSRLRHEFEHTSNSILQTILSTFFLIKRNVHLGAYTINLGNSISLPFLNPINKRPNLLTGTDTIFGNYIPSTLKVVVIDEQLHILWTIFTSQAACLTDIIQVAHIILPIEGITSDIPSTTIVTLRVLQCIVTLTIIATTRDSFVDEVPSLYLASTS